MAYGGSRGAKLCYYYLSLHLHNAVMKRHPAGTVRHHRSWLRTTFSSSLVFAKPALGSSPARLVLFSLHRGNGTQNTHIRIHMKMRAFCFW